MLKVESVDAAYGYVKVLSDVSFEVKKGEIVTIIGANGAGKSTLMKIISGLLNVKKGNIVFEGINITKVKPQKRVKLGICQVPEGRQIFSELTVKDNLLLGGYLDHYRPSGRNRIKENMEKVFSIFPILKERTTQRAGTLSGGQQQMLAIARAMMSEPKLLLLDEPSMGLAPLLVKEIFRVIRELHSIGIPILLVEQNARAALKIADRGYVMETGNIVIEGSASELFDNPKVTHAYLGGE